jgi:hypothetical protein
MTLYEELRKHCNAPADQKVKILRQELLRPIVTVKSSVELLEQIEPELLTGLPEDISPEELKNTIQWLSDAANDLQQILDALTSDCADVPAPHVGD